LETKDFQLFKNISPLIFDPHAPGRKLFFKTVTYALVKLKKLIQLTF
jgi:hypothetical protein